MPVVAYPSVHFPADRRACLRTVSLGVPGLLLSGWAPASLPGRPVGIALPRGVGPVSKALLSGVDLGVHDVTEAARLLGVSLVVARDEAAADAPDAVPLVVTDADGPDGWTASGASRPRIHTCRLAAWRRGAWSVASAAPDASTCDWHEGLHAYGAGALNARFQRRAGFPMDERAWRGWMAVKVAFDVALRAAAGEHEVTVLTFDGHKGRPLRFGEDGHLRQPTYGRPPRAARG
jgi:hypothetical protein